MRLLFQPRDGVWTSQAMSSQAPEVVTLDATLNAREKDRMRTAVAHLYEPPAMQGQPGGRGYCPQPRRMLVVTKTPGVQGCSGHSEWPQGMLSPPRDAALRCLTQAGQGLVSVTCLRSQTQVWPEAYALSSVPAPFSIPCRAP